MTGCCAEGCTNRDSKGFLMKRFLRDPERRKQWEVKVRRANWKPTSSSYLCEGSSLDMLKTEVDIDEFHTREAVDKPTKKVKESQLETKYTFMETFVPNIRIMFEVALDLINIPEFEALGKVEAIRELGSIFNVTDYEKNLITYWILEILVEALKQSQVNEMLGESQKMSIVWITFILKEIATYGLKRRDMFKYLEGLFQKAEKIMCTGGPIPSPYDLVESEIEESKIKKDGKKTMQFSFTKSKSKASRNLTSVRQDSFKAEALKKQREKDFYLLINQIYSIKKEKKKGLLFATEPAHSNRIRFANRFKYEVIKDAFNNIEITETITICESIEKPKEPPTGNIQLKQEATPHLNYTKSNVHHRSQPKGKPKKDANLQPINIKKDWKKDTKKEFVQRVLKEISEPTKLVETKSTEKVIYPYLLPLNQAVQPGFFEHSAWQREMAVKSHLYAESSRRYSF